MIIVYKSVYTYVGKKIVNLRQLFITRAK